MYFSSTHGSNVDDIGKAKEPNHLYKDVFALSVGEAYKTSVNLRERLERLPFFSQK